MAAIGGVPAARQVAFSIFTGDTKLVDGTFTVMETPGVSCFGASRDFAVVGKRERVAIFQGAVFEHVLNADGSVFMSLKYYTAEPAGDSPIGHRQTLAVSKELSMGSESGNGKLESVQLGAEYEMVFRSRVFT